MQSKIKIKTNQSWSRVTVGIGLFFYLALILIFSALGDGLNQWSPWVEGTKALSITDDNSQTFNQYILLTTYDQAAIRFTMSFIAISFFSLFGYFGAKEISNLIFPNKKAPFIFLLVTLVFGYFFMSLIYLVPLYFYNSSATCFITSSGAKDISRNINLDFWFRNINVKDGISFATFGMWLALLVILVLTFGIDFILLSYYKKFKKRNIFSLLMLHIIIQLALFSATYTTIIRGWTTLLLIGLIGILIDTMSYAFGKKFGSHKLIAHISPNKTWEGAIYGIFSTLIIIIIIIVLYGIPSYNVDVTPKEPPQSYDIHNLITNLFVISFSSGGSTFKIYWWLATVLIVFFTCIIAIAGDLIFSYVKRLYGIKDYGTMLGKHGGLLDRVDALSMVFTAYLIYILLVVLISGRQLLNPNEYMAQIGNV